MLVPLSLLAVGNIRDRMRPLLQQLLYQVQ